MADDTTGAHEPEAPKSRGFASELAKHLAALFAAAAAAATFVLGALTYRHSVMVPAPSHGPRPPAKDANIVLIELGGSHSAPRYVINVSNVRDALHADFVFIAGYGIALIIGIALAAWLTARPRADVGSRRRVAWLWGVRRWIWFGFFAALLTIAADCAENLFLLRAISGHKTLLKMNCYDLASAASAVKFSALVPAAVTAVFGLGLAVTRGFTFPHKETLDDNQTCHALPLLPTDREDMASANDKSARAADLGALARWQRGYNVPKCECEKPPKQNGEVTGIGLSGGGIRAASVALGVLQADKIRMKVLPHAQYLVSVSGGGYTAGAFAQALTEVEPPEPDSGKMVWDPPSAFIVGSPEEDHIRRHSSYLADNPAQMLRALGLLAGHLLLTLLLLFGAAIVLGVAVGAFYFRVPITMLSQTVAQAPAHKVAPALPSLRPGALWALALTAVLAILFWLSVQFNKAHFTQENPVRHALSVCTRALGTLTVVIAALTIVVPGIIWVSSWLLHKTQGTLHVTSPLAVVVLTYVASLASLAWKNRSLLTKKSSAGAVPSAAPRGAVQIVLVIAALVVLAVGWLLLFGGAATVGLNKDLDRATVITFLILLAALVFLGGFTDETTLSLHPFYRHRLASAFAVRRVHKDSQVMAEAYSPNERTTLSRYGVMKEPTKFPHVIFAASATLGQDRTPPGKDRVSYTFCADWVGGPDVGYVNTAKLEELAPPRLRRDLTVQGAVALSGAAIAASVGGQASSWYETLFVISGARLGAWMPNPAFMIDRYREPRSLTRPGLPLMRRLDYLLCELFGVHPPGGPLLQVTDGGFYDNLGLIELFRRGCTRIYCVDASGDSPPAATTLAQALTAAYQELGVETTLDGTWSTFTAGSGKALSPEEPLKALSSRLSETGVISGDFKYPACGPSAGKPGRLVVAKASLWPELPYPLLAYAQDTPTFPHDSTGDQWFDDHQYAAYTELGRRLGAAAAEAMESPEKPPVRDKPVSGEALGGQIEPRRKQTPEAVSQQHKPIADNRRSKWLRQRGIDISIQWRH